MADGGFAAASTARIIQRMYTDAETGYDSALAANDNDLFPLPENGVGEIPEGDL